MKSKAADRYIHTVKKALVCPMRKKKEFLANLRQGLEDFIQGPESVSYEDIVSAFGTPEKQADDFLNTLDPKEIKKAFVRKRIVIIAVIVILISFVSGMVYLVIDGHINNHGYGIETIEDVPDEIPENATIVSIEGY